MNFCWVVVFPLQQLMEHLQALQREQRGGERRSRPWKDGGVQNLFAFYFSTYSGIKSKHFIVSGTVRGHVLVCNRAALWSVAQLSPAFLQCLLPGLSAHLCPHTYLPKPLTALLWNYQQPSKPLVSRADSLLIFGPVWSSEPHQCILCCGPSLLDKTITSRAELISVLLALRLATGHRLSPKCLINKASNCERSGQSSVAVEQRTRRRRRRRCFALERWELYQRLQIPKSTLPLCGGMTIKHIYREGEKTCRKSLV